MAKMYVWIFIFLMSLLTLSCGRKNYPAREASKDNNFNTANKIDSLTVKKVVTKTKRKVVASKVILVNDSVARKSIDGRLYYDLLGHRYWKNYRDGKYYLFNKSMYGNEAFKPK